MKEQEKTIKEMLMKQLELLHERSKECDDYELVLITEAMVQVASLLGLASSSIW